IQDYFCFRELDKNVQTRIEPGSLEWKCKCKVCGIIDLGQETKLSTTSMKHFKHNNISYIIFTSMKLHVPYVISYNVNCEFTSKINFMENNSKITGGGKN
ncbi:hypothetical protein L9F63_005885, partial [Diploptera punctata]